jgi:hypothetical protein
MLTNPHALLTTLTMQGQWVKGQYHGRGKYSWPDGRSYEGDWEENKMHGQGVYTDINGHRWVDGQGPMLAQHMHPASRPGGPWSSVLDQATVALSQSRRVCGRLVGTSAAQTQARNSRDRLYISPLDIPLTGTPHMPAAGGRGSSSMGRALGSRTSSESRCPAQNSTTSKLATS